MSSLPSPSATPLAETLPVAARAVDAVKLYGKGENVVHALDGVTIDFEQAAFTAIMGPSGSGKSTLMHCLAGLDSLTSGKVYIGEHRPLDARRQGPDALAAGPGGFRLPGLQPAADARRGREHHAPTGPRRQGARQGLVRPGRLDRRPGGSPAPPAERALRGSAAARRRRPCSRHAAPHHLRRRADRQPRQPQQRRDPRLHAGGRLTSWARRSSWSRTIRRPRPTPTGSCSSPTARSSTRCAHRRPSACWTA